MKKAAWLLTLRVYSHPPCPVLMVADSDSLSNYRTATITSHIALVCFIKMHVHACICTIARSSELQLSEF